MMEVRSSGRGRLGACRKVEIAFESSFVDLHGSKNKLLDQTTGVESAAFDGMAARRATIHVPERSKAC